MDTVTSPLDLRKKVLSWRRRGLKVGFVPTMGNLHTGHLSLVKHAKSKADRVVVSVFVNPLQFDDKTDLYDYPRTLEVDLKKLSSVGCDLVFTPNLDTMYPNGLREQSKVTVPVIGEILCGHHRSGHFEGVATVVSKLFNMVLPDTAVFGEKDYQQLLLIKKLTQDLNMSIEIIGGKTYREPSGLAMSSRNKYLSSSERILAAEVYNTLEIVKLQLCQGEQDYTQLCLQAEQVLKRRGFAPEYVEICNETNLMPANHQDKGLRIMVAAKLGQIRLIDNIACHLD